MVDFLWCCEKASDKYAPVDPHYSTLPEADTALALSRSHSVDCPTHNGGLPHASILIKTGGTALQKVPRESALDPDMISGNAHEKCGLYICSYLCKSFLTYTVCLLLSTFVMYSFGSGRRRDRSRDFGDAPRRDWPLYACYGTRRSSSGTFFSSKVYIASWPSLGSSSGTRLGVKRRQ